jgi:hypothetical protein
MTPEGYLGVGGIFSVILPQVRDAPAVDCVDLNFNTYVQNTKVSETQEFSRVYYFTASEKKDLKTISVSIMSYRGDSTKSDQWMDEEKCEIPCSLSMIKQT